MHLPRTALALAAVLLTNAPSQAQVAAFEPDTYGKSNLSVRQSTGDAAAFIAASEGGAFEPIVELSPNDQMALLARPVGRVDILMRDPKTGDMLANTCTGSLLGGGLLITNHHCLPQNGGHEIVKASILMGYNSLDGAGAERFAMEPAPVEWSAKLDFAIARVDPAAEERWGHVALGPLVKGASPARVVLHHPLGRPKVMSRFRCFVFNDRGAPPIVAHRCDTLPGSSGSLLFDNRGIAVALHRAGGLKASDPTSFNMAIDMDTILKASRVLSKTPASLAAAQTGHTAASQKNQAGSADASTSETTRPADGRDASQSLSTEQMNNILSGN